MKIIWLSMIICPHEACTRYPGSKILDPSDYKPGLGIVDAYLNIYKILKECIDSIKNQVL